MRTKVVRVVDCKILVIDDDVGSTVLGEYSIRDSGFFQRKAFAQLHEHRIVYILCKWVGMRHRLFGELNVGASAYVLPCYIVEEE
jgi:hypothetical protein